MNGKEEGEPNKETGTRPWHFKLPSNSYKEMLFPLGFNLYPTLLLCCTLYIEALAIYLTG